MIRIGKSETADTRTCDYANVTKETLLASSRQHIRDVQEAHQFFSRKIAEAMLHHDPRTPDGSHPCWMRAWLLTHAWFVFVNMRYVLDVSMIP